MARCSHEGCTEVAWVQCNGKLYCQTHFAQLKGPLKTLLIPQENTIEKNLEDGAKAIYCGSCGQFVRVSP